MNQLPLLMSALCINQSSIEEVDDIHLSQIFLMSHAVIVSGGALMVMWIKGMIFWSLDMPAQVQI
jgi:hypothetical protein